MQARWGTHGDHGTICYALIRAGVLRDRDQGLQRRGEVPSAGSDLER